MRLEREVAAAFACLRGSGIGAVVIVVVVVVVVAGEIKKVIGVVFEDEKVVLFGEAESGDFGSDVINLLTVGAGWVLMRMGMGWKVQAEWRLDLHLHLALLCTGSSCWVGSR